MSRDYIEDQDPEQAIKVLRTAMVVPIVRAEEAERERDNVKDKLGWAVEALLAVERHGDPHLVRVARAALSKIEELDEQHEHYLYAVRNAHDECTCDLLPPFGHVTCASCNHWSPSDDEDYAALEAEEAELGIV